MLTMLMFVNKNGGLAAVIVVKLRLFMAVI